MPSKNKTTRLQLNAWVETDKPTRADFVADNNRIDEVAGGHIANTICHVTAEEKLRAHSPFKIMIIQGTNDASRTISFDFEPQIVLCYALDHAPTELDSGVITVNSGIAVQNYGGSNGCELSGTDFFVTQATKSGIKYNLNNSGIQYVIIGFR